LLIRRNLLIPKDHPSNPAYRITRSFLNVFAFFLSLGNRPNQLPNQFPGFGRIPPVSVSSATSWDTHPDTESECPLDLIDYNARVRECVNHNASYMEDAYQEILKLNSGKPRSAWCFDDEKKEVRLSKLSSTASVECGQSFGDVHAPGSSSIWHLTELAFLLRQGRWKPWKSEDAGRVLF